MSLLLIDANTTLLENAVALALFRKYGHDSDNERVFFYNNNVEVDFYVPEDELAIQVSYSIGGSEQTFAREVEALQKLPAVLACKQRFIITFDEGDTLEDIYGKIEIIPFWKWVLK